MRGNSKVAKVDHNSPRNASDAGSNGNISTKSNTQFTENEGSHVFKKAAVSSGRNSQPSPKIDSEDIPYIDEDEENKSSSGPLIRKQCSQANEKESQHANNDFSYASSCEDDANETSELLSQGKTSDHNEITNKL